MEDQDDVLAAIGQMIREAHPDMPGEEVADLLCSFAQKIYGADTEEKEGRPEAL